MTKYLRILGTNRIHNIGEIGIPGLGLLQFGKPILCYIDGRKALVSENIFELCDAYRVRGNDGSEKILDNSEKLINIAQYFADCTLLVKYKDDLVDVAKVNRNGEAVLKWTSTKEQ